MIFFSLQQTDGGGYVLGGNAQTGISGDKKEINLGLDDYWVVKITSRGICEIPTELYSDTITATNASLHWDAMLAADKYILNV